MFCFYLNYVYTRRKGDFIVGVKVRKHSFIFLLVIIMALALLIPYTFKSGAWFTFFKSGNAFFEGNYKTHVSLTGSGAGASLSINGVNVTGVTHAWDVSATGEDNVIVYLTESATYAGNYDVHVVGHGDATNTMSSSNKPYQDLVGKFRTITVYEGITTLGQWMFHNAQSVSQVTFPSSLLHIKQQCFRNLYGMTEFDFSVCTKLKTLEQGVVAFCRTINEIKLPASLESVSEHPFLGSDVKKITIAEGSEKIALMGDCLITLSNGYLLEGYEWSTIPKDSRVKTIGQYAFYGSKLKNANAYMVIPSNIKTIRYGAFYQSACKIFMEHTSSSELSIASGAFDASTSPIYYYSETANYDGAHWRYVNGEPKIWEQIVVSGSGAGANVSINNSVIANVTHAWDVSAVENSQSAILYLTSSDSGATYSAHLIGEGATKNCASNSESPIYSLGSSVYNNVTSLEIQTGITTIGERLLRNIGISELVIPEGVTRLEYNSFVSLSNLTSLSISSTVNYINAAAIILAPKLETITVASNNSKYHSENNCVIDTNLNSLIIGCKNSTIPDYITDIAFDAFYGAGITSLVIPDSVLTIKGYAFGDCDSLTSIKLSNNLISIANDAFRSLDKLSEIVIPSSVTSIGANAFYESPKLAAIFMMHASESEVTLDANWLNSCSAKVYWYSEEEKTEGNFWHYEDGEPTLWCTPNYTLSTNAEGTPILLENGEEVTTVAYYDISSGQNKKLVAFIIEKASDNHEFIVVGTGDMYNYSSGAQPYASYIPTITNVIIKEGMTSTSNFLMQYAVKLQRVSLPNSLKLLRWNVFDGCTSLDKVVVPENVYSISSNSFRNCSALTKITFKTDNVTAFGYSVFQNCSSLKKIDLPNGITALTNSTFHSCVALEEVTIPDTVTAMGNQEFYGCTSLKSFNMPNSVTSIGTYLFYQCTALENVTLSNQLTNINERCFDGCNALKNFIIPNSVTTISAMAIRQCFEITELIIPDSVTTLGNQAIYNCKKLKSLVVPDSVTSIGTTCFAWNYAMETITLSKNITSIPNSCFEGSNALNGITIPEKVETIGEKAFSGCNALTYVNFETNVLTEIKLQAFQNCYNITKLVLPNSVITIGDEAFRNCNKITSMKLSSSLQTIGVRALYQLSSLTEIIIPASVTSIGQTALSSNNKMQKMYFEHTDLSGITFGENWNIYTNATQYLYSETQKAGCWHYDSDGVTPILW